MITALHTLVYTDDAEAAREFFRDVLGFPHIDTGGGWLIFGTGPSELGVHPTDGQPAHHELSFVCDDIESTVAQLRAKGVEFTTDIVDEGWGMVIRMLIPGGAGDLILYQPNYDTPFTS